MHILDTAYSDLHRNFNGEDHDKPTNCGAAEIQLNHCWLQDTPLHFANCFQQIDTVELLLKARAGDQEGEGWVGR